MFGWMLQWNGYEPGFVGAVKVLVPVSAGSSNAPPSSEVTVCAVPSLLSTVMLAPGLTESGVVKLKFSIVMVEAWLPESEEGDTEDDDDSDVAPEDDDVPPEPQVASAQAHRPARTSRADARVLDMSRPIRARSSAEGGGPPGLRGPRPALGRPDRGAPALARLSPTACRRRAPRRGFGASAPAIVPKASSRGD